MDRVPRPLFLAWLEYWDLRWERQTPEIQLLHKLTHAVLNFLSKTPVAWTDVVLPADRKSPRWTEPMTTPTQAATTDQWNASAPAFTTQTPTDRLPPRRQAGDAPDVETMKHLSIGMVAGKGKLVKKTRTKEEAAALVRVPSYRQQPQPPQDAPRPPQ